MTINKPLNICDEAKLYLTYDLKNQKQQNPVRSLSQF